MLPTIRVKLNPIPLTTKATDVSSPSQKLLQFLLTQSYHDGRAIYSASMADLITAGYSLDVVKALASEIGSDGSYCMCLVTQGQGKSSSLLLIKGLLPFTPLSGTVITPSGHVQYWLESIGYKGHSVVDMEVITEYNALPAELDTSMDRINEVRQSIHESTSKYPRP